MIILARPETAPKTEFALRLRDVRRRNGDPDRSEFAEKLGISVTALATYERGEREPSVSVLAGYRKNFGVNVDWLITGHGEMLIGADTQIENTSLADVRKYVWNIANSFWKKLPRKTPPEQAADQFLEMFDYLLSRPTVSDEAASEVIEFSVERKKHASGQGEP